MITLLLLAFIGSVAGLLGGIVFLLNQKFAHALAGVAVPLATGILITLSFLELLPEAVELLNTQAYVIVLAVFVILFLIERFAFHLHHHEDKIKSAVPLVIFGDTIHNFLDGAAIAAAYLVSPGLGLTVAFATFLHETPHEMADFGILVSAGWTRTKAFWANFLSALATFPGAIIAYYSAATIQNAEGIFIAVAAGLFLYIAATDFLPEVGHDHGRFSVKEVLFFLFGIAIIIVLGVIT